MKISDLSQILGRRFPAGRTSQGLVGENRPIVADGFCMGFVTLDPFGGQVPWHSHPNEEIYMILEGEAEMALGDELQVLRAGQVVYIPGGAFHQLTNLSAEPTRFLYCYSPAGDVDHWRQELDGTLPRAGDGIPDLPPEASIQKL